MSPKNEDIDTEIDENLRRVYQQTLEEDVPDRLKSLLEQLRKQSGDEKGIAK